MSKRKTHKKGKQRASKKQRQDQDGKLPVWLLLLILAGVTLLVLTPLFAAGFVDIDDKKLILDKAALFLNRPWKVFSIYYGTPYYKPVTYFTWMLEYRAVGANAFLFHFDNVLLHILNTLMVFFLTRQVAARFDRLKEHVLPIAFFSALLFGIHPMHVESVAWVVERKDVLYTFFYLLGLLGYVRYLNEQKLAPLALSAVAYALSLLSKAPGITMPAVLFMLDFAWQRKFSKRLILDKAGHFAVFVFALVALGIIGHRSGEGSLKAVMKEKKLARASNISEHSSFYGKVVLAGLRAWLWYLHSLLPVKLSLGYPREQIISFFGPLIHVFPWLLAGAGGVLFWFRRKARLLFFANGFFFLTLAPAIVRLDLGIGIFMSDRYVYLSLFGLIFLVVGWLLTIREKGWLTTNVKTGIVLAICIICAVMSFSMSRVWKSTETLWTNVIDKYPQVDYAYINRGSYYRDAGEYDKAMADISKGLTLDDNANAHIQRGLILRQTGKPREALKDYNRALELEPDNTQAYTNRGNAYLDLGKYQQAISDYEVVLKEEPNNVKTRVNMAIAYSSLHEFDRAEAEFKKAERWGKDYADLYMNRAIMYYSSQQYAKAAEDYKRYLTFHPDDHQIYNDLGVVYMLQGKYQDAVDALTNAIALSPVKDYFRLRSKAYEKMGNAAAAQQDLKRAQ